MDKSVLERFARAARIQLIQGMEQRLIELGLSQGNVESGNIPGGDEIRLRAGETLTNDQKKAREELIDELRHNSYDEVVEQAAYAWFSRLVAVRFMEVNGYLSGLARLMSVPEPNSNDATIKSYSRHQISRILPDINSNRARDFRLLSQFAQLSRIMPFVFDDIENWMKLLFPLNLPAEGYATRKTPSEIPEDYWVDRVEIVGWLYQYYVSEKKDEVYAKFKKGEKATRSDIPLATQLFTPNWIVKYMVDNSLGRLWLEARPDSNLRSKMDYYIEEADQDKEVRGKLEALAKKNIDPAELSIIDPACGSGHILIYAFDLLYHMYLEAGYPRTCIAQMILEQNLYGLDIDERAAKLAAFALMMQALRWDPKILDKGVCPNVFAVEESNGISKEVIEALVDPNASQTEQAGMQKELLCLLEVFYNAKDYGALIEVEDMNLDWLPAAVERLKAETQHDCRHSAMLKKDAEIILRLAKQAGVMSGKYEVVVTNPPYMYRRNMNERLKQHVRRLYGSSGADLSSSFMEQCLSSTADGGFTALLTQHSWMFLIGLCDLRSRGIDERAIYSMIHLGARGFETLGGEVVQSTAFVIRNASLTEYKGRYVRLVDYDSPDSKIEELDNERNWYVFSTSQCRRVPGSPIAYWVAEEVLQAFEMGTRLADIAQPRAGLQTGKNRQFLRLWHEVEMGRIGFAMCSRKEAEISGKRWFPYNKGGKFRKWYGNCDYVVDWEDDGTRIRNFPGAYVRNPDYYFNPSVTWTFVGSSRFCARYSPPGFLFDVGGSSAFPEDKDMLYVTAFLCSKPAYEFLKILNPTLNFQVGNIADVPIIFPDDPNVRFQIESLARSCIDIACRDWDSYETSWDFKRHPFLTYGTGASTVEEAFRRWQEFVWSEFREMKQNEEEINRLFIELYGLDGQMTPEVSCDDVTICRADRNQDVRSFISYAVGCMFGRYSPDVEGIAFAGGEFDASNYKTFIPNEDGVIPILDEEYFEDDIVSRFVEFVETCFGKKSLDENLNWIAKTLGMRAGESDRDAIRRYFLDEFYKDHVRMYRKRPIYWMFSSGKQKAFNALIYMHRYLPDTLEIVRTRYLLRLEEMIDEEIRRLEQSVERDALETSHAQLHVKAQATKQLATVDRQRAKVSGQRTKINRELIKRKRQLDELREYDDNIRLLADGSVHINLDYGVAANYAKFKDVLRPIT